MKQAISGDEDVLNALKTACKTLGIDLKTVIKTLDLPAKLLSLPNKFVPSHLFNYLLQTIVQDYHCHDIALCIASELQSPQLGLPTTVMSLSSNLQAGLNNASDHSFSYDDTSYWQQRRCDDELTLFKPATTFSRNHFCQRNLLGTAQMFLLLGNLSDRLWRPNKLSFSFADPGAKFSQTFHDFFDCELSFDQANDEISFPADHLEFSISSSDPMLLRSVKLQTKILQNELFRDRNFIDRARLIIDGRLRFANCNEDELAFYMKMSAAELEHELRQANSSFKKLLEQQIYKRGQDYLGKFHAPSKLIASALMPDNESRFHQIMAQN
jgi:hypothetical protein